MTLLVQCPMLWQLRVENFDTHYTNVTDIVETHYRQSQKYHKQREQKKQAGGMGLQITVETVLGQVVDKSEDCAEKVVSTIRPHAKGLAKFSTLFFHILFSILLVVQFEKTTLFVGYSVGMREVQDPCVKRDVIFLGHDLVLKSGANPGKADSFDQCVEMCNEENADNPDSNPCKAVTYVGRSLVAQRNCWLKDQTFEEHEWTTRKPRYLSKNMDCQKENEEQSKGEFPTNTTYVMILLTILLLVTRVGSLILILRNKHALLACTVLAVPIFIFVIIQLSNFKGITTHFFTSVASFLSLIGCLMMVVAESMEEKDLHLVGLPSWGENRKMSVITLISRVNVILTFVGFQSFQVFGRFEKMGTFFMIAQAVVLIPCVVSVVVGYKTKIMSVILACWLTVTSMVAFPFYLSLGSTHSLQFWSDAIFFGVNFSGVGSLIYISVLGAGAYSVDHLKRQ